MLAISFTMIIISVLIPTKLMTNVSKEIVNLNNFGGHIAKAKYDEYLKFFEDQYLNSNKEKIEKTINK